MLINEVCKECNLTKKAVEYYTEQGLIQPRITENGYRQFSETDALKLKRIAVLRGLGFSVPEIRTILENDSRTAIYDVLNRKELEIVELQTKQALIKQLAESGDWEQIEGQVETLQNKQSILNRILNKFPGFYGKFVCLHFAPFLSEAITTDEQREAFETIIRYLDGISIAVPSDVQQYLDEIRENADAAVTQSASSALAAAMADPEKYIHDNKEMLEQYRAVAESEEYKASPACRLQEYLKQFQVLSHNDWIIEGVYYAWCQQCFADADSIYVLNVPRYKYRYRIIRRFVRRKLGLEKGKKENLKSLRELLKWADKYQTENLVEIRKLLMPYSDTG